MAERIGAGFRLLYYGVFDASGNFLGGTATAPAAGNQTGSPMLRLQGARTLPMNVPEPENVIVSGDDEPKTQFEFDAEALANGTFEMAVRNDVFEALIQGTNVWVHNNFRMGAIDPADRADVPMCLLLSRRAKDWAAGSRGNKKYQHVFIPQCSIKPLYNAFDQRTFNPYLYSFTASRSDVLAWTTVNDTEHGTTALSAIAWEADAPVMIQRFTGNAAQTVFNLTRALDAGGTSMVFVNRVQQAYTTNYTIAGAVLTFVVAPAAASVITVVWEYDESDIL